LLAAQQAQVHQRIQRFSNSRPAQRKVGAQLLFHGDLYADSPTPRLYFLPEELRKLKVTWNRGVSVDG
jgi:hypothetical protein